MIIWQYLEGRPNFLARLDQGTGIKLPITAPIYENCLYRKEKPFTVFDLMWCDMNCSGKFYRIRSNKFMSYTNGLVFELEDDMILFKLTFGE